MLALPLVAGPALHAQTWLSNAAGNTTWSAATWDASVPVSGASTTVNFFTANTSVAAGTNVAFNDLSPNPFVVNQLNIAGTGGATAGTLTLQGNGIAFDGANAQLNINPAYGAGGGYTVNIATPLTFNAPTAITFGGGGGLVNFTSASVWNGAGNVTFTSALAVRPLSLSGAAGTFSGDLALIGNTTVLQLNNVHNILGLNGNSTVPLSQSVTVGAGAGVNFNNNNGAFSQNQNFILNGSGNSASSGAALNFTRLNFGNGVLAGLAVATPSTIRIQMENLNETRGVTLTRGLVGTGDLIKTGNGYLYTQALGGNVTWGGNAYSLYTGNITINEGVVQTPANIGNTMGTNTGAGNTQTVLVNNGGAVVLGAANNAATNNQNFVLNGFGTGYPANGGGMNALTTGAVGFGSNAAGSIILQSDASVGAIRTAGGGNIGLSLTRGLLGSGTLIVDNAAGANFGTVFVNVASPASQVTSAGNFTTFTGRVVVNNGLLSINNAASLGANSAGQVYLSGAGAFASALSGGLNQAFFDRISNAATSAGAVALGAASANNLDFTSYPNLRLGASAAFTYSGNLTPGGGGYRLGGGGGTLTVASALTGATPLTIGGAVTLASANNTFSGGITIAGVNTATDHAARLNYTNGTGVLPSVNALTFAGVGGFFAYSTPASTAETSQALGNLTFGEGVGSVTATTGNSTVFGNSTLTFAGLGRSAGATGTLQTVNGTNGVSNRIVVSGLPSGFVNKGVFFNSSNYAFNDAAGFLRAPVYGTDAGFVTSGAAASVGAASHVQITGNITAQNTATFGTLRINAGSNLTLAAGQTLTVDGILKAGGTAVTISGGSGIQAGPASELVVNSIDGVTISTNILDNGGSSLTKIGAGSLTLTGTATSYSGGTTINQGTLIIGTTAGFSTTGPVVLNGGTLQLNSNKTVGDVTLRNGVITGVNGGTGNTVSVLTGGSYALQSGGVSAILAGSAAVNKTTEGHVYFSANNTYSGGTNVSAGSIGLIGLGTFGTGPLTISGGRVDLGGRTITNTLGPITGGGSLHRGTVVNNGGAYELQSGTITASLAGTNGLNKTTSGALVLTGNNTYTGATNITAGSLVLGAASLPGGGLGASKVNLTAGSTLDVSGVSASTVALSGGLGGDGSVNATAKTLAVGGVFTPGALSITGNLAFDSAAQSTFVAAGSPAATTALAVTGSVANSGTLVIDPAPGFTFAGGQSFTFVTAGGGITAGYTGVTVNGVALSGASGVWTATAGGLGYTYTESTAVLQITNSVTYTALQTWRFEQFGVYDDNNTVLAGNAEDFDGDGLANLLEYAFGTDPKASNASPVVVARSGNFLTLIYPRRSPADASLVYSVEGGSDLAAGFTAATGNTTNNGSIYTYTDNVDVSAPGVRRFLRLGVAAP